MQPSQNEKKNAKNDPKIKDEELVKAKSTEKSRKGKVDD